MKALTVRQPYAGLISAGIKDVENRSWRTHYRGRLWIHAAAKAGTRADHEKCHEIMGVGDGGIMDRIGVSRMSYLSVILGSVNLVDVVRDSDSPWAMEDHWHWTVEAESYARGDGHGCF